MKSQIHPYLPTLGLTPLSFYHPELLGQGDPPSEDLSPSTLYVPKNLNTPTPGWEWEHPPTPYTAAATIQVQSSCAIVSALSRSLGSPSALPCLPASFPRPLHTPTSNSQRQQAQGSGTGSRAGSQRTLAVPELLPPSIREAGPPRRSFLQTPHPLLR